MAERKREKEKGARNAGLEEQAEKLRQPTERPPREGWKEGAGRTGGSRTPAPPAATEHLENPPQIEGPRERLNESAGE